ncbi:hypothetical protein CEXT_805261 [Caerostris extrusa]|uniref:Uncharacterized protein n=1 Tax=Caerostris extrusa TaxID=172846 RepID=A0AAV4XZX9_CAEEX|nr:hypothetical protein CEXT_805261 [Caerostris extrusa]
MSKGVVSTSDRSIANVREARCEQVAAFPPVAVSEERTERKRSKRKIACSQSFKREMSKQVGAAISLFCLLNVGVPQARVFVFQSAGSERYTAPGVVAITDFSPERSRVM